MSTLLKHCTTALTSKASPAVRPAQHCQWPFPMLTCARAGSIGQTARERLRLCNRDAIGHGCVQGHIPLTVAVNQRFVYSISCGPAQQPDQSKTPCRLQESRHLLHALTLFRTRCSVIYTMQCYIQPMYTLQLRCADIASLLCWRYSAARAGSDSNCRLPSLAPAPEQRLKIVSAA